jgi:MoaA/NifB/PqqE/SkfB family radical SAM enzyme
LGVESLCLCGGEPTLRLVDILEVIKAVKAQSQNVVMSMVSNGIAWTKEIARDLASAGLDRVQFSLDGITEESYDFVRNSGGRVDTVLKSIGYALSENLETSIAALPHRKNINEFETIADFCKRNGLAELRVQPLMPLGRGENNYRDLVLSQEEYGYLKDFLYSHRNDDCLKFEWGDPLDHIYMLQEVKYLPMLSINAYGEVLVSPYIPISIWNCREHTLSEYIARQIPSKVLAHPLVRRTLKSLTSVDDFTSSMDGLPVLQKDVNLDLSHELSEMEQL